MTHESRYNDDPPAAESFPGSFPSLAAAPGPSPVPDTAGEGEAGLPLSRKEMLSNARLPGEPFEAYKQRRKYVNGVIKHYLHGTVFWLSRRWERVKAKDSNNLLQLVSYTYRKSEQGGDLPPSVQGQAHE